MINLLASILISGVKIKGVAPRPSFKNLEKIKLYLTGSTSVILRAHATRLPAAEPRPGPCKTPLFVRIVYIFSQPF